MCARLGGACGVTRALSSATRMTTCVPQAFLKPTESTVTPNPGRHELPATTAAVCGVRRHRAAIHTASTTHLSHKVALGKHWYVVMTSRSVFCEIKSVPYDFLNAVKPIILSIITCHNRQGAYTKITLCVR